MKIVSVEIMRQIDEYCIKELGIPGIVLMENAAMRVIDNIDFSIYKSFCIICSKGNNGGDGFAVARYLYNKGYHIEVFLIGNCSKMSKDCKVNYDILIKLGIDIKIIDDENKIKCMENSIKSCDMTIDSIFGTGLSRMVGGIYDHAINTINKNSRFILSIDVPSGMNGDTGEVMGNCVEANKTVSFQLYKKGFLNYKSSRFLGKLVVEDIGIPQMAVEKFHIKNFMVDEREIKNVLIPRNKYSHKGNFGRVLVISGSMGFSGAAFISTQSAVRSGAGLVTLACREDIMNIMSAKLVEAMTLKLEDTENLEKFIERSDVIAIGPGMGNNEFTLEILKKVLHISQKTVVIDADGINVLQGKTDILKNRRCEVIMTPHLGEMSRLCGMDIEYIEENRIKVAQEFARKNNVVLLLKGYNTVITDGSSTAINSTGNSAMASGGMGDCLTGMIASFAAQKYSAFKASYIAAYIHGLCGDKLSENMFCVNASKIIDEIPFTIKRMFK